MFKLRYRRRSYNWDGDHAVYTEEVTNNPDGCRWHRLWVNTSVQTTMDLSYRISTIWKSICRLIPLRNARPYGQLIRLLSIPCPT